MHENWFDRWARSHATRLSRRQAVSGMGAAGLAVAMQTVLPASAQPGNVTCQMVIDALSTAGPSADIAYAGALELTIGADGAVDSGSLVFANGSTSPVVGTVDGRALSLRVNLPDGTALVLTGTGENDIATCSGALSGVFGGPTLGDTGSWMIDPAQSQLVESGSGACQLACVAPFTLDVAACTCLCSQPNERCGEVCLAPCTVGEKIDWNVCACTPGCDLSCPDGKTLDPNACVCIDFCSDPAQPFYCGGGCFGQEQTFCLGSCHDLLWNDQMQCGPDCVICPNGVPCLDGVCECAPGTDYCPIIGCVDLLSDKNNCGECEVICLGSNVCVDGHCVKV